MARLAASFALLCVLAIVPACTNDTPPPGAFMAHAAFPKIGSTWVLHVTSSTTDKPGDRRVGIQGVEQQGFGDRRFTAMATTYRDAPAYGIQIGTTVYVYNPQTFNRMATIVNGKETETVSPDEDALSWPLWVGKSWNASGTMEGGLPLTNWGYYRKVTAYEAVTVPSGTFQAFRIESSPGQNIDPGFHLTQWYAPSVAYYVKTVLSLSGRALAGAMTTTTEMAAVPHQ